MRTILIAALVLTTAAAVLFWMHNREAADGGETFIPKPAHMTPEIERLQAYVRIDTSNPPGKELAGARFLAGLLQKDGVPSEIIESAPGRASLYARLKGRRPNEGLLLLNHIDVVPADPKTWTHPPFAASIAFNMMYGRGTLDMKGVGMCELEAFLAVARSGRSPERDIVFLAEADEEEGGALGLRWIVKNRPDVIAGVRYALNEGGITETQREELTYFGIEVGTKMMVHARLEAPSREQLQRLRLALEPYMTPRDPDRVLPEVRDFFHALAPKRVEQGQLLTDIDRTIATGKFWLLQRPYKELTQNVVWARGVNRTDSGFSLDVLMYSLPDELPERRIEWLQEFMKPFGARIATIVKKNGPCPLSSHNTPLFELLTREIHRTYGNVSIGTEVLAASSNDSKYLRPLGINCYGLWPFPVDYFQSQGIHGADERVRLDWYMSGVTLMKNVIQSYAFDSSAN